MNFSAACAWTSRGLALSPAYQAPPSGDGWLHEIKHDGFRALSATAMRMACAWFHATATTSLRGSRWPQRLSRAYLMLGP